MRSVTMLIRKHSELKKTKTIWLKRIELLHEADEAKRYNYQREFAQQKPPPNGVPLLPQHQADYMRRKRVQFGCVQNAVQVVRAQNRRPGPEASMLYHQYAKRLRLLKVNNTAHGFIRTAFKEPRQLRPVPPFYSSPSFKVSSLKCSV